MQQYKKEMKKVALLRNVPFCKSLSEPVILRLAKTMQRVTVRTQARRSFSACVARATIIPAPMRRIRHQIRQNPTIR